MSNKSGNGCRHLVRMRSCKTHPPSAFVDRVAIRRDGLGHVSKALFRCTFPVSEDCDRCISLSHSQGITKLSKHVHPDFHPFFPKTHRPFHFDDFFERIYRFYIPLLERNGYNMHRQNEIHEYVSCDWWFKPILWSRPRFYSSVLFKMTRRSAISHF